jgi:predicted unusual protein kinase regulating ubiquinone biosynthesis (AarF/ABC1/UbiB family)
VREALSVLQTHAQPMGFDEVRDQVLGAQGEDGQGLLDHMEPEPVAAASIGQVHRSRLPAGVDVAVKVQYPDIEDAIRSDFRAAKLGPKIASLIYPGAPVEAFVEKARERMLEECDHEREARMQTRFAELCEKHEVIEAPEVHDRYTSRRVLTTRFVDGDGFEAFLDRDPPQSVRDRIGEALFEFHVGTLFEHGVYNCDPHPGNYLFPGEETVAVLDHGCARVRRRLRRRADRAEHGCTRRGRRGSALVDLGARSSGATTTRSPRVATFCRRSTVPCWTTRCSGWTSTRRWRCGTWSRASAT